MTTQRADQQLAALPPGNTLTAVITGINDADSLGSFSYQWQAGGNDISGATDSTYILTQAQVGTPDANSVTLTLTLTLRDVANDTTATATSSNIAGISNVSEVTVSVDNGISFTIANDTDVNSDYQAELVVTDGTYTYAPLPFKITATSNPAIDSDNDGIADDVDGNAQAGLTTQVAVGVI